MLGAVILAAGESRRMGSPKALLLHNDQTFLEHLIQISRHPKVCAQRVVLGAGAIEIAKRAGVDNSMTVINPDWEKGQLSSMQAAIQALASTPVDGLIFFLVDHPLVTSSLVSELIEQFYRSGKQIVLPIFRGRRGHPVIFSKELFVELLAAPEETGARAVVWKHARDVEEVPTEEEGVILNLNDPDAFQRAVGNN
jgi:molybdenum cofactor cytidylyltransferase